MKLFGLSELLELVFKAKPPISQRGIKAKHHFPKPKPADPAKKKRRQMVQASKRRNRQGN